MSFSFRPAIRENVGLLIGLAGGTGSGKTYSAMRLAAGIAGDKPFCVIDTEAGRGKHYADAFRFDHGDLKPPFSPDRYAEAIAAADAAGYPVIVVDSMSHEHAGEGGLLDMHEAEFERMGRRDTVKMAAWIKPKMAHKAMVQKLLQVRAHLILCFRAEEKIEIIREDGKTKIVPKVSKTGLDGWTPISEKNLPYELTASFLLTADKPGIPKPIKLQEQHRSLFPLTEPITEESGRRLAQWASGGEKKAAAPATNPPVESDPAPPADLPPVAAAPHEPDPMDTVDKDTGEVIPPPAGTKKIPLLVPDGGKPHGEYDTVSEWMDAYGNLADLIAGSVKLSPGMKEKKLRALKAANDALVRTHGTVAVATLNQVQGKRITAVKEQAAELAKAMT